MIVEKTLIINDQVFIVKPPTVGQYIAAQSVLAQFSFGAFGEMKRAADGAGISAAMFVLESLAYVSTLVGGDKLFPALGFQNIEEAANSSDISRLAPLLKAYREIQPWYVAVTKTINEVFSDVPEGTPDAASSGAKK